MSEREAPENTDAELEAFRRQWQAEVQSRNSQQSREAAPSTRPRRNPPPSSSAPKPKPQQQRHHDQDAEEEAAPQVYYDLPDKEAELKLDAHEQALARGHLTKEPESALEHY